MILFLFMGVILFLLFMGDFVSAVYDFISAVYG